MKLSKVIISNFKSFKKVEEVIIDDKVTILIGANDHGKSNLLEAILRLNPDKPITQNDTNWDCEPGILPRIEWRFTIEEGEIEDYRYKESENQVATEDLEKTDPIQAKAVDFFDLSPNQEFILFKEGVDTPLKILSTPFKIAKKHENELFKLVPKIEPFLNPVNANLKDEVSKEQLVAPEFEFMKGIFCLAGLWEQRDVVFTLNDTTAKVLSEASEKLTKVLNEKWNQGKDLVWNLSYTQQINQIRIQINDPAIDSRFTRPSLRSSGFQTYFVLSMMINARTYSNPTNSYIFLFDEPGIYLHPYAQLDLQRGFESISQKTQVIYSTHSLFLINKNYPERNRVVSKTLEGTKINQKPFSKNWKSVRESLGILLSNNFLIADKSLLVEGPSDIIYILDSIKGLKQLKKIDIDLNDFSMVDAGNSENYVAMAKLMLSEGRSIVALLDGDSGGDAIRKKLEKACSKEKEVKQLVIFQLSKDHSTEDIFCEIDTLRTAIKSLADELITCKVRKYRTGFDINVGISKISSKSGKTLGKTIAEETKNWFEDPDSISKLAIAMRYEDLVMQKPTIELKDALIFLQKLKGLMELREEISPEGGVYKEISK
jgi:predicted ATP-dependent endonuclease of OLD family